MFRRHQNRRLRGSSYTLQKKKGRDNRFLSRRQFSVERLEERFMLSGSPWVLQGPAPAFGGQVNVPPNDAVSGAIQAVAPHPTNANILYVGAVNGGVWKTTNATAASPIWTPLTESLPG